MEFNGQSYICKKHNIQRKLIKKNELTKIAEWIIKREECLRTFKKVLKQIKNPNDVLTRLTEAGISLDLFSSGVAY
jgi:hypothetical protein